MHEVKQELYERAQQEGYVAKSKKRKVKGKVRERTVTPAELAEDARRVAQAREARRPLFNPEQLVVLVVDEDDVF